MPITLIYAFRNVLARKGSTAVTMLGVSVSVLVFVLMSATAKGISRIASSTGSPLNVLVTSEGAASAEISYLEARAVQQLGLVRGIAVDASGDPMASVEFLMTRSIRRTPIDRGEGDGRFVTYRGVTRRAFDVHDGVRLERGVYPRRPGEILMGNLLARKLEIELGTELWINSDRVVVSGIFDAPGQVFAGEIWVDLDDLRSQLGRTGASAVVVRVSPRASAEELAEELESAPNLDVSARPEPEYYLEIQRLSGPFASIAAFVGFIMGLGAILAGTNTLYAAMSRRTRELGTLRALGFGRWFVAGTLLLESILVSLIGGLIGLAVSLGADGFALNLVGLSFELVIDQAAVLQGVALSLLIGVAGGVLPARSALALRIIEALRHA